MSHMAYPIFLMAALLVVLTVTTQRYLKTMAKYFYINAEGQKEGPVCPVQLRELATEGSIEPDTRLLMLSATGGAITSAKHIPELSFDSDSQEQETQGAIPFRVTFLLICASFL